MLIFFGLKGKGFNKYFFLQNKFESNVALSNHISHNHFRGVGGPGHDYLDYAGVWGEGSRIGQKLIR